MSTEPLPLLKPLQKDLDDILEKLKEQGVSQSGYQNVIFYSDTSVIKT